jgi:CDP-glucose 4,6-dehydratase
VKTYLVTGAGGFVGSHLAHRLHCEGHRVVALVRDDPAPKFCETIRGSLEDMSVMRRAVNAHTYDGIFHLAAHAKVEECRRDRLGCFESNVRGTYTLMEALEGSRGVPVVMATTDHVYGDVPPGTVSHESDPFYGGGTAYDVSKACADLIGQMYGRMGDVRIVRCGNIFGPEDRDMSRVVPSMINDALDGRRIQIRSDGTPVREYLHVNDAVEGYMAVMTQGSLSRIYNLGGTPLSVKELADRIALANERAGGRAPREHDILGTRKGDIQRIVLDSDRAGVELGWAPRVTVDEGLYRTLLWWCAERKR